jgi:hypothetical protein
VKSPPGEANGSPGDVLTTLSRPLTLEPRPMGPLRDGVAVSDGAVPS